MAKSPNLPSLADIMCEQIATAAGYLQRGGIWFNERFDGPQAAEAAGADTYESAYDCCHGEGLLAMLPTEGHANG